MKRVLLVLSSAACATAAQSAHPVAPGKTEVTASIGRVASTKEPGRMPLQADDPLARGPGEGAWTGELMVRRGIVEGLDAGLRLSRMPGAGGLSVVAIDPKLRLGRSSRVVISLGIPAGLAWEEAPEAEYVGAVIVPTVYVGLKASPTVELVAAPKLHFLFVDRQDMQQHWGLTLSPRFTDPHRRWAVQPELGLTWLDDTTLLLLGFSVSAGN